MDRSAPNSAALHFVAAARTWGLPVLMPLVSKIGPLPDVLGAPTLTPFWRRHAEKRASA